jgi:hypothetical protein
MKNLAKKSLVILGLCTSLMGYSNTMDNGVKEKEPKITNLRFESVKHGSVLSIKDQAGLILYKESIDQNGEYSKGFDLNSLPDGEYYFELDSELKFIIVPFTVSVNDITFNEEEKNTIIKPILHVKDEMVYLSRPSFVGNPLTYKIFFAENYDLVLSEKFEQESEVKRVYDFSKAEKGNYVFVFESNGRKYSKAIKI